MSQGPQMSIGGLVAKAALLKQQKPTKPCERCGLHYVAEENEQCPHCGSLSETELRDLLEKQMSERRGRNQLGIWFVIASIIIVFLMVVISVG